VSNPSFGLDRALTAGCCSGLSKELKAFYAIREQSTTRRFLLQEEEKQKIVDIFQRVKEARLNMMVGTLDWP
jgi:hypothetical protein